MDAGAMGNTDNGGVGGLEAQQSFMDKFSA